MNFFACLQKLWLELSWKTAGWRSGQNNCSVPAMCARTGPPRFVCPIYMPGCSYLFAVRTRRVWSNGRVRRTTSNSAGWTVSRLSEVNNIGGAVSFAVGEFPQIRWCKLQKWKTSDKPSNMDTAQEHATTAKKADLAAFSQCTWPVRTRSLSIDHFRRSYEGFYSMLCFFGKVFFFRACSSHCVSKIGIADYAPMLLAI